MSLPEKVSSADLARLLGIVPRTITKLVERKVLRREGTGTFDLIDAVQSYVAHRESVVATEHGVGAYGKARAELYLERARIARLQREKLEGSLVSADEMIAMNTSIAAVVKARMLAVGPKLAPCLVRLAAPAEAERIVSTEITEGLTELSQLTVKLRGRGGSRRRRHSADR